VKQGGGPAIPTWAVLAELPNSLKPLVKSLAIGLPPVQEKEIEVLWRQCPDQSIVLGDLVTEMPRCIVALANRVIYSSSLEVKVGGTTLLICVAKEHKKIALDTLNESEHSLFTLLCA